MRLEELCIQTANRLVLLLKRISIISHQLDCPNPNPLLGDQWELWLKIQRLRGDIIASGSFKSQSSVSVASMQPNVCFFYDRSDNVKWRRAATI